MIQLLAQSTQPTSDTVQAWAALVVAITGLLGAILAVINSRQAKTAAGGAQTDAAQAKTAAYANTARVSDVSQKVDTNRNELAQETNEKIKLAMMPAPSVVVLPSTATVQPPAQAPPTENIGAAMNAANQQKPE